MTTDFSNLNPKLLPCNDGHQGMILLEEVTYTYRKKWVITVPVGLSTDGISSPGRFNNRYYGLQKYGYYFLAGLVHDYLYLNRRVKDMKTGYELVISKRDADRVFRDCCKDLGCPSWRYNIATAALISLGWFAWWMARWNEHTGRCQAWDQEREHLLYKRDYNYPQRLVKLTRRELQKAEEQD